MNKITFLFIFSILFFNRTLAQESMLPDVSYTFLKKLVDTAKAHHPQLRQSDARIKSMRYAVNKAKLSYFDVFTFSYLYNPNNTTTVVNSKQGILSNYQTGFFINIGSIVQKPVMVKMAKEDVVIARLQKEENELNLETEVRSRYFTYLQTQSLLRFKTGIQIDAESMMKETKVKFQKGQVTLDAYTEILMTYSDHTAERINAEAAYLSAKSNLEMLVCVKLEDLK